MTFAGKNVILTKYEIAIRDDERPLCAVGLQFVQDFVNQTWLDRYNTVISESGLTLIWSTIVSIFTIGGLIGVTVGGTLSVKIGR